ncbi:MAG: iron-containing redox enzyme family protein [Propionibacteriales bacterium]|nr:iron-containing redox enzyme family protein [Propionibacteriales bacterium]
MRIPTPCGPVSQAVHDHLDSGAPLPDLPAAPEPTSRDHALALWMLHELAYRGFDGVDPDLEWSPDVLRLRNRLNRDLEAWLRQAFATSTLPRTVTGLVDADGDLPGVARFVRERATADDVRRILVQRSVYHLKEADPQCFVLPRLEPAAKAALTELQYDELGDGDPARVHQHLFAEAMAAAGLDPTYGAYVDEADEETLTLNNAISLLCLHRRLRHAAAGHLAAFEATSALPSADMVRGLQRLGFSEPVWRYYDEHVEADAVHEHLARDICDLVTGGDPELEREVVFGAFVCIALEERCARRLVPEPVPA